MKQTLWVIIATYIAYYINLNSAVEPANDKDILALRPAYHAQAKYYKLQGESYNEIISYTKSINADFLIIDKNIRNLCPNFKEIAGRNEDLKVVSRGLETDERAIVIYELKK